MCHYFSYFSAPAVRIFLNVVQWKWPRGRSKFCKWLSQNILVCSKWDILDQKSHVPLDLLPLAPTPLMKKPGISKKNSHQKKWRRLSRNYTLNWKSCWRKISKVYFFLPLVNIPSIRHNMVSPSKCLPSTTLPPSLSWPPYEAVSQNLRRHTYPPPVTNSGRTIKDWRAQEVHEKFMKGGVHENYINNFFNKKIIVWGKWTISGPKLAHPCNSQSTIKVHEVTPKTYRFLITSGCPLSRKVW